MNLVTQIIQKNDDILDFLMNYNNCDLSIFRLLGMNLTLINYEINHSNDVYVNKALQNIEKIQVTLNSYVNQPSVYSQGLVSLGVVLDYIEKYKIADIDNSLYKVINYTTFKSSILLLNKNNLDFIAGATGIGFIILINLTKNFAYKFLAKWVDKTYFLIKHKIVF